jgi:hypothetical protein
VQQPQVTLLLTKELVEVTRVGLVLLLLEEVEEVPPLLVLLLELMEVLAAVLVMLMQVQEVVELQDKEMMEAPLLLVAHGVAEAVEVKAPLVQTEKLLEMGERAPILMLLGQPQLVQALTVVTTLEEAVVEYIILLLEIPQGVLEVAEKESLELEETGLQVLLTLAVEVEVAPSIVVL